MSLRINKAKNFAGKSYIISTQLDELIKSMKLSGNIVNFTGSENSALTKALDLTKIVTIGTGNYTAVAQNATFDDEEVYYTRSGEEGSYVYAVANITAFASGTTYYTQERKNINTVIGDAPSAGKVVVTDTNGNFTYTNTIGTEVHTSGSTSSDVIPNETAVRNAIDAVKNSAISVAGINGIVVTGDGTEKTIGNTIKLVKKSTANEGFAASYELKYRTGGSGTTEDPYTYTKLNDSDDIDIIRDQFLKDVVLGYGTFVDADTTPTDWTTTQSGSLNTILKLVFDITRDGADSSSSQEDFVKYINVDGMFHDKTAGDGISSTDLASNKITVVVDASDKVYTSKGVSVDAISVSSSGVKVQNIQAAIDLAVNDQHTKASEAISSVNTKVQSFESSVNSATSAVVVSVNNATSAVVASVNSAVTATTTTVNTKVDSAVANINTNVGTVVSSINTNVGSAVTAVNTKVDSAVANINTNVGAVVSSINTNVTTAVTKAVELVETSVALTAGTTSGITVAITSGNVSVSGITGNILAVFGADGIQIEPEITKSGKTISATNVLSADYGSATVDASWVILHTKAISYTDASYTSADDGTDASYTDASYTSADDGTDASYTDATVTNAVATEASYDNSTTVLELDYKTKDQ